MSLLVVRHAHAGERRSWKGEDRARPLSEKGLTQARGLVDPLAALQPARILTSPAVRCRQTVEPLAARCGITIEEDERLFEGTGRADIASLLDDVEYVDPRTTVLCSHGDVIPLVLDELDERGMTAEDPRRWSKGSAWIVEHLSAGWGRGRYLAPPA